MATIYECDRCGLRTRTGKFTRVDAQKWQVDLCRDCIRWLEVACSPSGYKRQKTLEDYEQFAFDLHRQKEAQAAAHQHEREQRGKVGALLCLSGD